MVAQAPAQRVLSSESGRKVTVGWLPTRKFSPGPLVVRAIVVHSAECAEVQSAAESLAQWGSGPSAPQASWHFAVDDDSITQSVDLVNIAWHAGSVNPYTIGIEHAGRASQTAEQWRDEYSDATLARSARLVALLCERYGVPVKRVSVEELRHAWSSEKGSSRVPMGILGHVDVSRAIGGTHTDPGVEFPWDEYLHRVSAS